MSKLKAAVIGVGQMGKNHARVYSQLPQVDLIAIADKDLNTANKVGKQWNAKPYSDHLELLRNEQPDIVSVAVPTHLHYSMATAVIAHNCPLLLEKPIADDENQAKEIILQAEQKNIQLMIGHIERFNPAVHALRQSLLAGELGQIYYLEAHRAGPSPVKPMKSGVTLDLAVHDIDIIQYITKCNIKRISATASNIKNKHYEDWIHGTLFLSQNIIATIHCDWITPIKRRELSVIGAKGTLTINYLSQDLTFHKDDIRADGGIRRDSVQHAIKKKEPLLVEIESFISIVKENKTPSISGKDGLNALIAAKGILRSAQNRRTVTIPPSYKHQPDPRSLHPKKLAANHVPHLLNPV